MSVNRQKYGVYKCQVLAVNFHPRKNSIVVRFCNTVLIREQPYIRARARVPQARAIAMRVRARVMVPAGQDSSTRGIKTPPRSACNHEKYMKSACNYHSKTESKKCFTTPINEPHHTSPTLTLTPNTPSPSPTQYTSTATHVHNSRTGLCINIYHQRTVEQS